MWTESLLHGHDRALAVFEKRSQILANNLAHSETPDFKARDIDFQSILKQETSGSVLKDLLRHEPNYRESSTESLNGNTVDQATEVSQWTQNNLLYRASLHFLSHRIQSLKLALRGE